MLCASNEEPCPSAPGQCRGFPSEQHAVGQGSFETVGWVDGAGTTTEVRSYHFSLEGLSAGTHRFRLQQVDMDGTANLSEATTLTVQPDGPVAVQQMGAHPVRNGSTIRVTTKESEPLTVALCDVLGRRVETLHRGRDQANQPEQVRIDASSLAAGTCFLRMGGDAFAETRRIAVAR